MVVGAGVVGLAVARALAAAGRDVLVLERENAFGTATSSRNSEVMHAGLYYPPGSLKAALCVAGRRTLGEYCRGRGIAHRNAGKLIVATDRALEPKLEAIRANALACGVDTLSWLDSADAIAMEPALRCTAALWSPATGIVDSHGLMLSLLADAERDGAQLALVSPFERAERGPAGVTLRFDAEGLSLRCNLLVNSAGLHASEVAQRIDGLAAERIPVTRFAKGNYFALFGRCPFTHLIYPVPEPGGLGVHLTLDLQGRGRFGPDVEWIDGPDYTVDPARGDRFYGEVRRYWPALGDGALQPDYAGVRPKLSGPGADAADFEIDFVEAGEGVRLVNLFGIESPGLTASLAIGEYVAKRVGAR